MRVNMKKFLFLALFFSFNLFSSIEGIILNQKGNVLSNVKVVLLEKNIETLTDKEGKFSFAVEEGEYTISFLNQVYKVKFKKSPIKIIVKTFEEEILVEPPGAISEAINKNIFEIPKGTIAENLTFIQNISLNGLGGAFQTVSIDGMAKQRVQVEVEGYKIEGLRRAGTDFGIFHPDLFDSLSLYKIGTGFTHGSNAMGGTIDFYASSIFEDKINTKISYGTNNKDKSVSFLKGFKNFSLFSGYQSADYYFDGNGERQDGYFKRANLYGILKLEGEESINYIDLLLTKGWDIGKPFLSTDKTEYPENNLHLFGIRGFYKNVFYQFGTYYQDLETRTTKERSFFKSINLQGKFYYFKGNYSFGFETNSFPKYYANNRLSSGFYEPLKDSSKYDFSLFSSYEKDIGKNYKFFSGLRLNYFKAENLNKEKETTIPGIYLKLSKEGNLNFDISFYNIYRFPSIEELFYSGMTARGYVEGNENLKSKEGYGISFKLSKSIKENEFGFFVSYKDAKNYIERYKVSKDLYSYKNIDEVEIYSGAVYFQNNYFFSNLSYSKGENKKTSEDIDDQKPFSLNFGFIHKFNNFQPFLFFTLSDKLKNPGPNELERDGYFVLNLGTNYYFSDDIYFSLKVENLFDKEYIPQGDEKAVAQIGRNFLLTFAYNM